MNALIAAGTIAFSSNEPLYTQALIEYAWLMPSTSVINLSATGAVAERPLLTAHEVLTWLQHDGLPIAAIADIVRVERKSVYAWMNGGPIRPQNQNRLEKLHNLLSNNALTELSDLYRFWNRKLVNGTSLALLLKEENLDAPAIKKALDELWPLALKAKKVAVANTQSNRKRANPFLENMNEVIIPDES
jgi:hypothetical protein